MIERLAKRRVVWLVMALALFVSTNMVSREWLGFLRLDLTEQGLYSLSDGSRALLRNMNETIDLRLFYSRAQANDLPVVKAYAARVIEFLNLYGRVSGGRVRLQVIEPEPFTDAEDEAMAFGVQAVPVSTMGDKLYLGLVATNSVDDMEVIPFLDPERERFLEYDMARILHRLSQKNLPKLGLVTGLPLDGGVTPAGGYQEPWVVMSYLRDMFDVISVDIASGKAPDDLSLLMLVHPRDLDEKSLYAIDQFVMRGGHLLVFTDPVAETSSPLGGGSMGASSLNRLLETWGVRMVPDKVLGDPTLAVRVTSSGESESRLTTVYYLPWLELRGEAITRDHVTAADLQLVRVASAGVWEKTGESQAVFTPLLTSSDTSGLMDAALLEGQPDAEGMMRDFTADGERRVIAGHLHGWLKSAFPQAPKTTVGDAHLPESVAEAQVMLVADTDLLRDVFWVQGQNLFGHKLVVPTADNGGFVTNMLEYLSGSQALIGIRSRGVVSRPFEVVEKLRRDAEARFRDTEDQLKRELQDTEANLAELQRRSLENSQAFLSSEEQATLEGFRTQLMALRKELRDVQHALQRDITGLGSLIKFLNIVCVPLLVLSVVAVIYWKRQRMA